MSFFLDELIESGLVVEIDGPVPAAPAVTPWATEYEPPRTERYDDIADIMTMDPIHEVDTTLGWPHTSPDPPQPPKQD